MRTALPRTWTDDDDALLECILALGHEWGQRAGRVTLRQLGIETRLVTFVVAGICPTHGQFVREWTGLAGEGVPLEVKCSGARCDERAPVFVLV